MALTPSSAEHRIALHSDGTNFSTSLSAHVKYLHHHHHSHYHHHYHHRCLTITVTHHHHHPSALSPSSHWAFLWCDWNGYVVVRNCLFCQQVALHRLHTATRSIFLNRLMQYNNHHNHITINRTITTPHHHISSHHHTTAFHHCYHRHHHQHNNHHQSSVIIHQQTYHQEWMLRQGPSSQLCTTWQHP